MERQNVTLSIPKDLLAQAKVLAAKKGTSLSGMLAETLEQMVKADSQYEQAMHRHLAILEKGFDLGTYGRPPATRDELHER